MIHEILTDIGLKNNEALIYLALLRLGTTQVSRLVIETKLPKATIYDTLDSLEKKGIIHSYMHSKTTKYTAEDPTILEYILNKEAKEIKKKQNKIATLLPDLYGIRNKHIQIPKVRLYQGLEGMGIVLEDSLSAKEVIRTLVNVEDMEKYFHDINKPYAEKRVQLGIKKRVLVEDTSWCRHFLRSYPATEVSDIHFLPTAFPQYNTEMNIYDNKVTYITYRDNEAIGVIIEDTDIYQVQKALFDSLWSITK